MNSTLKKVKDIISENCVTIILNTHRTRPDNQKDALTLKNLIKEAEVRLLNNESKRDAKPLIDQTIDHSHNQESLIFFVNEDMADYVRLPIEVENRVIIDNTFATRDLVRALHLESSYYVLVLSQQKVRLIEAFNDKVVSEIGQPFPIDNIQFYSTNKAELSDARRQTNLIAEFFNRVNKEVSKVRKGNPLPVLICTEESNYYEYLKIADQKMTLIETYLNKNRLDEKAQAIVTEAWGIIKNHLTEKNNARKAELQKAVSSGKFLSDVNDIWRAIFEGRIQTLFIEKGLFQPGIIKGNEIRFVSQGDKYDKEVVDDIYDQMIEANMNFGGDVIFLPKGELTKFQGFGAITRY
jgi:hypothetical protein